ncbi:MAG: hypothetical protein ACK5Q5_05065, partial [Planctomycetaceae bacterium]
TCSDENIRSGKAAVQYAERANQLTQEQDSDYLDTLAAAAATSGDFNRAVEVAKKAVELSPAETRAEIEARLALYQKEEPYVEEVEAADREAEQPDPAGKAESAESPVTTQSK